jgi:hypothetical protein
MWRMGFLALVSVFVFVPQVAEAQNALEGIVSGTVINAATGEPLANAAVVLRVSYASFGFRERQIDRPLPSDTARTITDTAGKFEIPFDTDAPASLLFVSHESYRSEDNREIAMLPVRANGAKNVLVRMIPQSVIEGRALDISGEPLRGILIQAIREEIQDGARRSRRNFASAITGLQGEYKLNSLVAGVYHLQASGMAENGREGYGPVYFPEANEARAAESIRIGAGDKMVADFKLAPHPVYEIRGALANANVLRRVNLRLLRGDEPLTYPASVSAGNRAFQIEGVPPGSYTLQAYTPDSFPVDYGEAQITVTDHDLNKVQISMTSALDVRGRIEFTGAKHPQRYAFVVAEPLSAFPPLRISPSSRAMMAVDGSFVLRNLLPGEYQLSVRLPPDSYVDSIMAGNVDVQQKGFAIGPGKPPELKITIRRGGGTIEGSIEGPEPAVPVLLVQKRGQTQITTVVSSRGGRFLAVGLAPGDYSLYALPIHQQIEYKNPDVLNGLSQFATEVSVADGERAVVKVKAIPPPQL